MTTSRLLRATTTTTTTTTTMQMQMQIHIPSRRRLTATTGLFFGNRRPSFTHSSWMMRCFATIPSPLNDNNNNKKNDKNYDKIQSDDSHHIPSKSSSSKSSSLAMTKALLELSKARLSALVVSTTAAGFLAAGNSAATTTAAAAAATAVSSSSPSSLSTMVFVSVGTALCSSSAAAWNQIYEQDLDAKMKRTQHRPLVQQTVLTTNTAILAASVWGISGTAMLAYGTDPYTTMLGVGNIGLYAGLYTYMKPRTIWNTWVGAVVGAIPPVMGWSAATGGTLLEIEPILLGSMLYLWQMPHFFALSFMHRLDYKRGGFQMVPVLEEDGIETAKLVVRYAWYLSTIPILSTLTGVTSTMFALEGILLNGYALHVAYDFSNHRTNAKARKVFLTSLWYLPCLLMLFLLHSKTWNHTNENEQKEHDNIIRQVVDESLQWIRNGGRQLCIHETAIQKHQTNSTTTTTTTTSTEDDNDEKGTKNKISSTTTAAACPILLVQTKSQETLEEVSLLLPEQQQHQKQQ